MEYLREHMKVIPSQPSVRLSTGICHRSLQVITFTAMTLQLVMIFMKTTSVSSFSILPVLPSRTATSRPGITGTRTSSTILYENNSNNNNDGSSGGLLSDFFNAGKAKLMKNMAGEYDSTAVQEQINTYIQNNPVLMLSFDTCPFCVKAKSILDSKNIQYGI